jgi:hypothetical protein
VGVDASGIFERRHVLFGHHADRRDRCGYVTLILLLIVVALVVLVVGAYNRLVRSRVRIDEAWAQIDTQLQRRHDLIPNLVETVKGYAAHERETFEEVTAARAKAISVQAPAELAEAENGSDAGARQAARHHRELPAAEGRRELPSAPGGARAHREHGRRDRAATTTRRSGPTTSFVRSSRAR